MKKTEKNLDLFYSKRMDFAGKILETIIEGKININAEQINVPTFSNKICHQLTDTGTYDT